MSLGIHFIIWMTPFCSQILKKTPQQSVSDMKRGWGGWLGTVRKTCVSLVLHFACFVFAGVFISDVEPSRVCQAPVSMQAIISASFEVCACVWACMHVCVRGGIGECYVDVWVERCMTLKKEEGTFRVKLLFTLRFSKIHNTLWGTHDEV